MEQAPFPQGFQDQRNIALVKVTNAAVNELCAAARGALCEIVGLEQDGSQAACGGVHRHPEAGCSASDHDHVPLAFKFKCTKKLATVHKKEKFKGMSDIPRDRDAK
jgi:hypothetical protein